MSRAYGLVWLSLTRDYCAVVMARRVQTRSATSMGAAVAAIHRGLGLSADRADRPHPFGKVNGGWADFLDDGARTDLANALKAGDLGPYVAAHDPLGHPPK